MATSTLTELNKKLPPWAYDVISKKCIYCDSYLVDNSETGVMTARWCYNIYCPGHTAKKVEALAKYFNISGVGVKTGLNWALSHPKIVHLAILKDWFSEPPEVPLSTVAELAYIKGYGGTNAVKELSSFRSFEEYFDKVPEPNLILRTNKLYLCDCESYFCIKEPMAKVQMTVMATGTFNGYVNRDEYFRQINEAFGSMIHVVETTGVRKTGVAYLIKEPNAPDRSKSHVAKEYGIKVVTPAEFFAIMCNMCHIDMNSN